MSAPLLLTGPNAPNIKTVRVDVPAGHVLPDGNVVQDGFAVLVQAGARWHPDWDRPRYSVVAYRILAMGDAICFSGDRAAIFPLPEWAADMVPAHGLPAGPGCEMGVKEGGPRGQLFVPFKPERIVDFLLPHQRPH